MKILLLGDASNYHHSLSIGLAKAGHQVTVASHGSRWMDTVRDIDLSRRPGKLGGAILWLKLNTLLAKNLRGYDVVQVHNPLFVDLRPQRVKVIFDRLRRDNGGVFLTALGTDPQYVEMCHAQDSPLRYNEFTIAGKPTNFSRLNPGEKDAWLAPILTDYCGYFYDHIDGAVSALYEYHLSVLRHLHADNVAYGGIPIDTSSIPYRPIPEDTDKVNFVVACHKGREAEKGIDILLPLLRELEQSHPDRMKLDLVQNVPFAEFQRRLDAAHVVVDQLYSYTPATTALMAMAGGKVTVSGGDSEYYDFIHEHTLRPILHVDPLDMEKFSKDIQQILDNPSLLLQKAQEGRDFVLKHNDVDVVARRFIDFWERRIR